MNSAETSQQTAELVQLAQRELQGDSVLSDDAGFARLQARLERPRRFWNTGWIAGGVAVAGALAAVLLLEARPPRLTFQVAGGAVDGRGHIVAKTDARIHFSDGTEASLESGAEAQVGNITEHGADVVLTRGKMHVHVAKLPQAAWKVAAGPYNVRVTGTAFDISWSNRAQAFDLRMETGAVIVTGPLAVAGIPLRAGQHMFGGVAEGRLTVEGGDVTPAAAAPALPTPEPRAEAESAVPRGLLPGPALRDNAEAHLWTREVAQGHFDAVLEDAERRGLERTLGSGSLEELAALADAARYAGRSAVAKRVLLAERQRFASSAAAHDAAFFLGRIAEDNGGGAIDWYERYVSESPRGAYASQAFGRKMMLLYKQRGPSAAAPIAAEYFESLPERPLRGRGSQNRRGVTARVCAMSAGLRRLKWAACGVVAILPANPSAFAEYHHRVLLLERESGAEADREITTRVRAELGAAGFDVVVLPVAEEDPKLAVEDAGHELHPASVLLIERLLSSAKGQNGGAELWLADRMLKKTVVLRLKPADTEPRGSDVDATNGREAARVAVQAVELVKARLAELSVTREREPAPPIAAVMPFASTPNPPAPRGAHPNLTLGIGLFEGFQEGQQSLSPMLRLGVALPEAWTGEILALDARAGFMGLGRAARIEHGPGAATLRHTAATLDAVVRFLPRRRVQPFVSLGGGMLALDVAGVAPEPYRNDSARTRSGLLDASGGIWLQPMRGIGVVLEGQLLQAWTKTVVRIAGQDAAEVAAPLLFLSGGVMAEF